MDLKRRKEGLLILGYETRVEARELAVIREGNLTFLCQASIGVSYVVEQDRKSVIRRTVVIVPILILGQFGKLFQSLVS